MKNIDRIHVESSYINSVGYNIHSSTLEIEFKPDYVVFDYLNVPYSVYVAFMNSSSLGKFFHKYIKHHYQDVQII